VTTRRPNLGDVVVPRARLRAIGRLPLRWVDTVDSRHRRIQRSRRIPQLVGSSLPGKSTPLVLFRLYSRACSVQSDSIHTRTSRKGVNVQKCSILEMMHMISDVALIRLWNIEEGLGLPHVRVISLTSRSTPHFLTTVL
jgi:hypothetical protein